jgi:hypothetical protein
MVPFDLDQGTLPHHEQVLLNQFAPLSGSGQVLSASKERESRATVHLTQNFNGLNALVGLDRRLLTV